MFLFSIAKDFTFILMHKHYEFCMLHIENVQAIKMYDTYEINIDFIVTLTLLKAILNYIIFIFCL